MASINLFERKVPLLNSQFLYMKNGSFKEAKDYRIACERAHSEGDGSGKVYSYDEYSFEDKTMRVSVLAVELLPAVPEFPFSGKAAKRHFSAKSGCTHEKKETIFQKDYPAFGETQELVTCSACLVLLEKITHVEDENGNKVSTPQYVGFEPNCDFFFLEGVQSLNNGDTLTIDYLEVPCVYEAFAADEMAKDNTKIFRTEAEAIELALTNGDGSLEYLVSKLYQLVTPTNSYEVEVVEVRVASGEMSEDVAALNKVVELAKTCKHPSTHERAFRADDDQLIGDEVADVPEDEIEFIAVICDDCETVLLNKYFTDACQPEFSRLIRSKSPNQARCSHKKTVSDATPEGFLRCVLLKTDETLFCADCGAFIYTVTEIEPYRLMSSYFRVAPTFRNDINEWIQATNYGSTVSAPLTETEIAAYENAKS